MSLARGVGFLLAFGWLAACDGASEGAPCEPLVENSAALGVDEGLVLLDGRVVTDEDGRTSDLVCYASGSSFDLKSRVRAGTTDRLPLRWFRDAGGRGLVFASLTDVPDQAPTSDDANLFVNDPQPGFGFTVATPDSASFARVRVDAVSPGGVTLSYQLHVTCE
jgi:hypothetical protein